MNAATRKALEGSIRKWRRIVAVRGVDLGTENCPLCDRFLDGGTHDCKGCPVRKATGQPECRGTPYYDFLRVATFIAHGSVAYTSEARKAAQVELDFLISLRPKTAKRAP